MTHRLLRGLNRREAIKDRVTQALGVLKAFNVITPGGFQLNIDVTAISGSADSGNIEEDLTELLGSVGEAARAGRTGVVYLIDEMQYLEPVAMGALCMAFHKLAQQQLPVTLVGGVQGSCLVREGSPSADSEGAHLRSRARHRRFHRAALRCVHAPPLPAGRPIGRRRRSLRRGVW